MWLPVFPAAMNKYLEDKNKMDIFSTSRILVVDQLVLKADDQLLSSLGGSVGCAVWLKTGSTPTEVGNILSWRLNVKYFLRSFSPFRWFKKGSCQFLPKECAQYWFTAKRAKLAQ